MAKYRSVSLSHELCEELDAIRNEGESYESIIRKLMKLKPPRRAGKQVKYDIAGMAMGETKVIDRGFNKMGHPSSLNRLYRVMVKLSESGIDFSVSLSDNNTVLVKRTN